MVQGNMRRGALLLAALGVLVHLSLAQLNPPSQAAALLQLKAAADGMGQLKDWSADTLPCQRMWGGVAECTPDKVLVTKLFLGSWGLEGSLPTDPSVWSALASLAEVDLKRNRLSGVLPPAISGLAPNLTKLTVANNQLSGSIPSFSDFQRLQELDLENNNFSGPLPPQAPPSLRLLKIRNNARLCGGIPPSYPNSLNVDHDPAALNSPCLPNSLPIPANGSTSEPPTNSTSTTNSTSNGTDSSPSPTPSPSSPSPSPSPSPPSPSPSPSPPPTTPLSSQDACMCTVGSIRSASCETAFVRMCGTNSSDTVCTAYAAIKEGYDPASAARVAEFLLVGCFGSTGSRASICACTKDPNSEECGRARLQMCQFGEELCHPLLNAYSGRSFGLGMVLDRMQEQCVVPARLPSEPGLKLVVELDGLNFLDFGKDYQKSMLTALGGLLDVPPQNITLIAIQPIPGRGAGAQGANQTAVPPPGDQVLIQQGPGGRKLRQQGPRSFPILGNLVNRAGDLVRGPASQPGPQVTANSESPPPSVGPRGTRVTYYVASPDPTALRARLDGAVADGRLQGSLESNNIQGFSTTARVEGIQSAPPPAAGPPVVSSPAPTAVQSSSSGGGGGFPTWAAAVCGILGALVVLGVGLWMALRYLRKRKERGYGGGTTYFTAKNNTLNSEDGLGDGTLKDQGGSKDQPTGYVWSSKPPLVPKPTSPPFMASGSREASSTMATSSKPGPSTFSDPTLPNKGLTINPLVASPQAPTTPSSRGPPSPHLPAPQEQTEAALAAAERWHGLSASMSQSGSAPVPPSNSMMSQRDDYNAQRSERARFWAQFQETWDQVRQNQGAHSTGEPNTPSSGTAWSSHMDFGGGRRDNTGGTWNSRML